MWVFPFTKKRWINGLLTALLALVVLAMLADRAGRGGDFNVYLRAGATLQTGGNPYAQLFFPTLQYFYSPLFAWVLAPVSRWHFVPEFVWLLGMVWMMYRLWRITQKYLDPKALGGAAAKWWGWLTLVIMLRFIIDNLNMVQMTIFLLWACVESTYQVFEKGKTARGAALLVLGINIKLMPLPVLCYWLYRGKFRAAALTAAGIIGLLLLPALTLGWERNAWLHAQWWQVINPANAEHSIESENSLHSLTAAIPVLLMPTADKVALQRNLVDWPYERVMLAVNLARLALCAGFLAFLATRPFRPAPNRPHAYRELAYLLLLIPLIFPHQQKYAFIFTFPAVAYVIHALLLIRRQEPMRWRSAGWRVAVGLLIFNFLLFALSGRGTLGKHLHELTAHFRLITWCALLLIPYLYFLKPQETVEELTIDR